jgi:2-iminobutanoate/2-iminopropanoate deaminase
VLTVADPINVQVPLDRRMMSPQWRNWSARSSLLQQAVIMEAAGSSMDKIMQCGVFLKNMTDFGAMNDVYGKIFDRHPPARTTVEVARLPKDSLVEIDAIALE